MSLQRIDNPSNAPLGGSIGVTQGYQRQNTNMFAARVGIDTTIPFDGGGTITVPIGGIVEANGVMYSITSAATLPKPVPARAYWIVLVPAANGATATFQLVERPGVWDPARNACYFSSGTHNNRRTLNWVSRGALNNAPTSGAEWAAPTVGGRHEASLQTGWKFVSLASGMGSVFAWVSGVEGGHATAQNPGGGGGGATDGDINLVQGVYFHSGGNVSAGIGRNGWHGFNGGNGGRAGVGGNGGNAHGGGGAGGPRGAGEESRFSANGFSLVAGKVAAGERFGGGLGFRDTDAGYTGGNGGGSGWNGQDGQHTLGPASAFNLLGRGGQALGILDGQPGFNQDGPARGGPGGGGAGGQTGRDGWDMPDGSPGGFCNVFALGN